MTRFLNVVTTALVLGIPAIAHGENQPETTNVIPVLTAEISTKCALSRDVLSSIAQLREFGERFQPVIDLIIQEAAKPDWTWESECSATNLAAQAGRN